MSGEEMPDLPDENVLFQRTSNGNGMSVRSGQPNADSGLFTSNFRNPEPGTGKPYDPSRWNLYSLPSSSFLLQSLNSGLSSRQAPEMSDRSVFLQPVFTQASSVGGCRSTGFALFIPGRAAGILFDYDMSLVGFAESLPRCVCESGGEACFEGGWFVRDD
ncbi:hypothetical protein [Amaricoccus tamworthensis]|uniref:hypothetical protein n=1 Tax=Amaricoccus tamworthensis TaxID=57002 RepID=UPI003C7EB411